MNFSQRKLYPFGCLVEAIGTNQDVREIDHGYIKELLRLEQLVVLRGFKTFSFAEELVSFCERLGEVSEWPFGKVLELIEQDKAQDHIFDNSYVPLHWDGMYRPQVPELQIFHCVQAPMSHQGGRTTFSHTGLVLKNTSEDKKKLWEKVTGVYQRKMEFYNSRTVSPIITQHPYKDFSVIRYNEPPSIEKGNLINPPDLEFHGIDNELLEVFHAELKDALYAPQNFYAHEWQSGDVVIADNFTLLHGREGFVSQAPRHLQRVHVLSDIPFNNPGLESYQ